VALQPEPRPETGAGNGEQCDRRPPALKPAAQWHCATPTTTSVRLSQSVPDFLGDVGDSVVASIEFPHLPQGLEKSIRKRWNLLIAPAGSITSAYAPVYHESRFPQLASVAHGLHNQHDSNNPQRGV
jgi:hypothetical protein